MTTLILAAAAWTAFGIDPYGETMHLNHEKPRDAAEISALDVRAAKGEFESASFLLRPDRDMKALDVRVSDLTGPGGATLAKTCADVKSVKVWYQPKNSWTRYRVGIRWEPELLPDMLLHDSSLIKVDEEKKANFLRIGKPGSYRYVDMTERKIGGPFADDLEEVADAKSFVPFDVGKGRYQQYWITWKVPKDAKPGTYKGEIAFVEAGRPAGALPVSFTVYPFELPTPRTHYDPSREYTVTIMGTPTIGGCLAGSKDLAMAERKARYCYQELFDHNVRHPDLPIPGSEDPDDVQWREVLMMREIGYPLDFSFGGSSCPWGWLDPYIDGNVDPEKDRAKYERYLKGHKEYVEKTLANCEKVHGHRNMFMTGADEAAPWTCRRELPFWRLVHDAGGGTFATSPSWRDMNWALDGGDLPGTISYKETAHWHAAGARAYSYAALFMGPECPQIWRRNKGIRFYYSDYDGVNEYCWKCGSNKWNDFQYFPGVYRQFGNAYPTIDGYVGTVALEGLREGIDDIRYLSLLRLRADAAVAAKDPKTVRLGRAAIAWVEGTDPEKVRNLDAFRRRAAEWIVKLQEKVGPEPAPKAPRYAVKPLPPSKLLADVASVPAEKALAAARAAVARNRYDVAFPLYRKAAESAANPVKDRLAAYEELAARLSAVRRRDEAVRAIDGALSLGLRATEKGRLGVRKLELMVTPRTYHEEFAEEQLRSARDEVAKLREDPLLDRKTIASMMVTLSETAQKNAKHHLALDLTKEAVSSWGLSETEAAWIHESRCMAFAALDEKEKTVREGDLACRGKASSKRMHYAIARAAEATDQLDRAFRAYESAMGFCDEIEQADERARLKAKLGELSRKRSKKEKATEDSFDGMNDISLDE